MKELILLVGPQGSGKTTYCNQHLSKYFRISQDDMGKAEHLHIFEKVLKTKDLIIIDRINHIRSQRRRYLEVAKQNGFKTKIINFKFSYEECYERILNRKSHPTLPNTQKDRIRLALSSFFNRFDTIDESEADEITSIGNFDYYIKDLTEVCKNKRVLIIGDVHGCYDELKLLLKKVKYKKKKDVLLFVGDIVDRGPKICECLEFIKNTPNAYSVLGNHDDKILRHLRGNSVKKGAIRRTLEQCEDLLKDRSFKRWLGSLPLMIKWKKDNYIVHAGIDPRYKMINQRKEFCLYVRRIDPTGGFNNPDTKFWFEQSYNDGKVYFGHDVHENPYIAPHAISLDGGCVFGKELRVCIDGEKIVTVKAKKEYYGRNEDLPDAEEKTVKYDRLVGRGFLNKSIKDNLALYNYTPNCTYEKEWNSYTRSARGLILDRDTGEMIALPFPKFFNLGEMPETMLKNLPDEPYEVFEKLDGSNGNFYWHKNEPQIATRGSFESIQAKEATRILNEKYNVGDMSKELTLIFEIIYPENRLSPGAYLVVDYGDMRDLVLLAVFNRHSREELNREEVEKIAQKYGFPICKRYNYTIDQMIELQKTLPREKEGFVVRFANGLRVKIKGDEYCKRARLLNSLTPLNIWNVLEKGKIPQTYMEEIPEEFRGEVEKTEKILFDRYNVILKEIEEERKLIPKNKREEITPEYRKIVGLWLKESNLKHPSIVFPYILGREDCLKEYIKERIRPSGNML